MKPLSDEAERALELLADAVSYCRNGDLFEAGRLYERSRKLAYRIEDDGEWDDYCDLAKGVEFAATWESRHG